MRSVDGEWGSCGFYMNELPSPEIKRHDYFQLRGKCAHVLIDQVFHSRYDKAEVV